MIDTFFGVKVRMSGSCINRYRLIIGQLLDVDYRLQPLPYRCLSTLDGLHGPHELQLNWQKTKVQALAAGRMSHRQSQF